LLCAAAAAAAAAALLLQLTAGSWLAGWQAGCP